jgi:hypothetical protein
MKNLGKKHLLRWLLQQENKFVGGNNLQETDLEVGLNKNTLNAEFVCRNGLGSTWSTERRLTVECPDVFVHLFDGGSPLTFEL